MILKNMKGGGIMKVIVIADNLGGGSAGLGRAIIEDIGNKIGWANLIVLGNKRLQLANDDRIKCFEYIELSSSPVPRLIRRLCFIKKFGGANIVLNLSNFPLGSFFVPLYKEICLLHNSYFFTVPKNYRSLGLKFIARNIIARRLILQLMTFFSDRRRTRFIVQTPWMQQFASNILPKKFAIDYIRLHGWPRIEENILGIDFLPELFFKSNQTIWFYPASGEPHKNHSLLFGMFAEGLKSCPDMKLVVTLPFDNPFTLDLVKLIEELGIHHAVLNVGWLNEKQKDCLLNKSTGIIFLSDFESLGIPLLEIRELKKRSLVINSDAGQYILGMGPHLFDLLSDDSGTAKEERNRFIKALISEDFEWSYPSEQLISIGDAYYFDWVRDKTDGKI
jgi:glycosyltransferase involved in cell wall biosynthesis